MGSTLNRLTLFSLFLLRGRVVTPLLLSRWPPPPLLPLPAAGCVRLSAAATATSSSGPAGSLPSLTSLSFLRSLLAPMLANRRFGLSKRLLPPVMPSSASSGLSSGIELLDCSGSLILLKPPLMSGPFWSRTSCSAADFSAAMAVSGLLYSGPTCLPYSVSRYSGGTFTI